MIRPIFLLASIVLLACAEQGQSSADSPGSEAAVAGQSAAAVAATPTPSPAPGDLLDPNVATREQLVAAGVDTAAVTALIAGRPYADMLAVDRALSAWTPEQRKTVYGRVWKPIDLNTATGEEILLIPGVGARMRHEFEEYRPYRSIEQFRREIGKYVDEDEVARLERYVTLK